MKIGDKVRFLNEVGGGIVTGFAGKNLVNVETEDGFEIPMPVREVVVDDDSYGMPEEESADETSGEKELEPADKPVTFKPMIQERKGGDSVNVYLCFVPVSPLQLTESDMDIYLVNDCNYFTDFVFMSGQNGEWNVRYRGTIEPNMKMYLQTVSRMDLNELEHLSLQMMFYKQGRSFLLKPAVTARIKPELSKFFKLHAFQPNDFFEERVLTQNVVVNDKVVKEEFSAV